MGQDFGWKMRSDALRRDAEHNLLELLRQHRWTAEVVDVVREGEYAVVAAERNGFKRRAALMYTGSTSNAVYRRLDGEVDLTLINGPLDSVEQYTQGLSRPVSSVNSFHLHLVEWNRLSAPDKLAPEDVQFGLAEEAPRGPRVRELRSEAPIDAIWSRLSRLKSSTLARKSLAERADAEGVQVAPGDLVTKGEGVAYAVRNAADYFALKDAGNVSQRVLNLYYGCMSFALAEMLAAPGGPAELSRLEDNTKQGHGLWTHDGPEEGFGGFVVGPLQSGFFPAWAKSMGIGALAVMEKKPKRVTDLATAPAGSWATMEQLFARIPEVGDLFQDVFPGHPAWVSPVYDQMANHVPGLFRDTARAETSYVLLVDDSGRMPAEALSALPDAIREIASVSSGTRARHFSAAVDHSGHEYWWGALDVHHSPFSRGALILPLYGSITQYRAVCVVILYALSILVRYRPSMWRRIQEGDLDHMRALVEAFLATVERVLPEQFLESITGEKVSVHQPGSLLG